MGLLVGPQAHGTVENGCAAVWRLVSTRLWPGARPLSCLHWMNLLLLVGASRLVWLLDAARCSLAQLVLAPNPTSASAVGQLSHGRQTMFVQPEVSQAARHLAMDLP